MNRNFIKRFLIAGVTVMMLVIAPVQSKAEIAVSSQIKLRIMETTDLHANLIDYDFRKRTPSVEFGLIRTASLIKQARKEAVNSLLFDNGDLLQGNAFADYLAKPGVLGPFETHPVYKAMNFLGYDAATFGNHEFNYGLDFLNNAVEEANFPYVNANIYVDDHNEIEFDDLNYYQPYVLLKKKAVDESGKMHTLKIGVIGFVIPQIIEWDKGHLLGKVKTKDIVASAESFVPIMKQKGADIIIALAHTGFDAKAQPYTKAENAVVPLSKVTGINAILFGHTHSIFPGGKEFIGVPEVDPTRGTINGVAAVEAGHRGNHLGIIDLTIEKANGKWAVTDSQSSVRPIYQTIGRKKFPLVEPDRTMMQAIKD